MSYDIWTILHVLYDCKMEIFPLIASKENYDTFELSKNSKMICYFNIKIRFEMFILTNCKSHDDP